MHPLFHSHSVRRRNLSAAAAIAIAAWTVSCASPGPPRPPSLHLPAIPTDLAAERIGQRVRLRWTTPEKTTDDLPVPGSLTAEICRETGAPPALVGQLPPCTGVLSLPTKPGAAEASDPLPPSLTSGPASALRYRIRILNSESRSAGDSKAVVAAAGSTPPPVSDFQVRAARDGVLLQWTPSASNAAIVLQRRLAVSNKEKPAPDNQPASPLGSNDQPTEVRLSSSDPKSQAPTPDPGGTIDRTAHRGDSYIYRAQRVSIVSVAGQPVELRSELSAPVTLNVTDTFPPSTPRGLATVPSVADGKPAIDLSWIADSETDLAGYYVYRSSGTMGSFTRLNPEPVAGAAYTDSNVTPGTSYAYRVTAVDATGNESTPSSTATETAEAPQPNL